MSMVEAVWEGEDFGGESAKVEEVLRARNGVKKK
jgi:hypothetical protein